MRKSCMKCTKKHLGQAIVLMMECEQGYALHRWLAVGHLAEAESESIATRPDLAIQIRDARLGISGGDSIDLMSVLELACDDSKIQNRGG